MGDYILDALARRFDEPSVHVIRPFADILGPFGEDSDLRRWGLKLAERGGKNATKRAIITVARKLAVLLHHLWISCEEYEPLHNTRKRRRAAA